MSRYSSKDCDGHQNSSFIFGLIFGLIIGAIIAIVIYRNNKQKVFTDLKKQLEKFFDVFKNPTFSKKTHPKVISSSIKKSPLKVSKITVILPPEIIKKDLEAKKILPKSKPRTFVKK